MLKKWIYIFTAFCLFNTIFCFHVVDWIGFNDSRPGFEESDGYADDGTLLDFLVQQLQDDSADNENKTPLKIKCRHNHFVSRAAQLCIQTPIQTPYNGMFVPEPTKPSYASYQTRKASRPSYYNFLFRLNPF